MVKTPVDVLVLGIGELGISVNCKGYGKSALFQTHSILDVGNSGFESDFMTRVRLEYDCCEELNVKFNISTVSLNTSFKHIVSNLDDLKIPSHRISDVGNMIREQEWKRKTAHVFSQYVFCSCIYLLNINWVIYTVQTV
jgi:hypothetical protein